MKTKLSLLVAATLALPLISFAAVDSSFTLTGSYTTGTDSQFDVHMSNYQSSNDVSVLNISNSSVNDIKSASFLDQSGWVKLTPYQSGSDILAKFISDTGFVVNGQRVITLRVNFKTPKTYIVGFALTGADGKTLSSAAFPIPVTGPKVLGATTNTALTRTLRVGLSGADVTDLQNRLTAAGVYSGPITGYFGRVTQTGVKAYQTKHGIPVTGTVDSQTLASLNQ